MLLREEKTQEEAVVAGTQDSIEVISPISMMLTLFHLKTSSTSCSLVTNRVGETNACHSRDSKDSIVGTRKRTWVFSLNNSYQCYCSFS